MSDGMRFPKKEIELHVSTVISRICGVMSKKKQMQNLSCLRFERCSLG
jgi:hypothetical protein